MSKTLLIQNRGNLFKYLFNKYVMSTIVETLTVLLKVLCLQTKRLDNTR